ncbi:unnamed protein product [Pleuronectes platessa]|uniref:Uncharacterized protein n=1 Tax=Pleuronectes platessa TaxID=8262 RepID=A0A9N7UZW7_PLEPL|nr:unnamed protein product [Pleuronectes platessa]
MKLSVVNTSSRSVSSESSHTPPAAADTSPHLLGPLLHHRGFRLNAAGEKNSMARVGVGGMPETAVGGGVMLNRRRSKARRKKRKELFGVQMCFTGVVLGLVAGLRCVSQGAAGGGSGEQRSTDGALYADDATGLGADLDKKEKRQEGREEEAQ